MTHSKETKQILAHTCTILHPFSAILLRLKRPRHLHRGDGSFLRGGNSFLANTRRPMHRCHSTASGCCSCRMASFFSHLKPKTVWASDSEPISPTKWLSCKPAHHPQTPSNALTPQSKVPRHHHIVTIQDSLVKAIDPATVLQRRQVSGQGWLITLGFEALTPPF